MSLSIKFATKANQYEPGEKKQNKTEFEDKCRLDILPLSIS